MPIRQSTTLFVGVAHDQRQMTGDSLKCAKGFDVGRPLSSCGMVRKVASVLTALSAAVIVFSIELNSKAAEIQIDPIIVTVDPSDDGWVTSSTVVTWDYVLVAPNLRGIMEFPTDSFLGLVESATLSVNPYGLPLHEPDIWVYGYESANGVLNLSDYSAGTVLGEWTLPSGLGFGQDTFFDVTTFLQAAGTPYVGFGLESVNGLGADVFSSLEFNYGHPAQLSVTLVPVIDYLDGTTQNDSFVLNVNTAKFQVLAGTATQTGVISEIGGARTVEKTGAGTLIFTADNAYTGAPRSAVGHCNSVMAAPRDRSSATSRITQRLFSIAPMQLPLPV